MKPRLNELALQKAKLESEIKALSAKAPRKKVSVDRVAAVLRNVKDVLQGCDLENIQQICRSLIGESKCYWSKCCRFSQPINPRLLRSVGVLVSVFLYYPTLTPTTLDARITGFPADLFGFEWCREGDLNPHGLHHTPLKRARLPVPPLRHDSCDDQIIRFINKTVKADLD